MKRLGKWAWRVFFVGIWVTIIVFYPQVLAGFVTTGEGQVQLTVGSLGICGMLLWLAFQKDWTKVW